MDLCDSGSEVVRESHCNLLMFWQYVQKSSFVFTEVNSSVICNKFHPLILSIAAT